MVAHFKQTGIQMDIDALMNSAKGLQSRIADAQNSLAKMHVKGIAGDGAVVIDMTGKYDVVSVVINPNILSRGATDVSKLVADAYRDAKEKADKLIDDMMKQMTGGFSLN